VIQAEVRKRSPKCKAHDTWVVEDFLEFGSGFRSMVLS
jgi:hypothetical protein